MKCFDLPVARRVVIAFVAALMTAKAVLAQPQVIRCLPPLVPIVDLPSDVLAQYHSEIVAEFDAYFAAISAHIACLDDARARALNEAHAATRSYSTLFGASPITKDHP